MTYKVMPTQSADLHAKYHWEVTLVLNRTHNAAIPVDEAEQLAMEILELVARIKDASTEAGI
jgi:DNA transposition AAA+ family ATPase